MQIQSAQAFVTMLYAKGTGYKHNRFHLDTLYSCEYRNIPMIACQANILYANVFIEIS